VPSIAKLMSLAFIQRANETAQYLAMSDANCLPALSECDLDAVDAEYPQPDAKLLALQASTSLVSVPKKEETDKTAATAAAAETTETTQATTAPPPPVQPDQSGKPAAEQNLPPVAPAKIPITINKSEQVVAEEDIFEDPTQPQPLEGRWAGAEAAYGNPQITLSQAVAAGTWNYFFLKDDRPTFAEKK
jgi:hypothetical protein